MERLDEWCSTRAASPTPKTRSPTTRRSPPAAARSPPTVADEIQRRRVLILMLGDTSMGMINGYFGPRLLNRHGFTEHKVDQAWIIDRGRRIDEKRIDDAFAFVKEQGRHVPLGRARRRRLRRARDARAAPRLPVGPRPACTSSRPTASAGNTSSASSRCVPPRDFAEGLLNSTCRPESNGDTIACAPRPTRGTSCRWS